MCILINAHVCACVHICACIEGRGGHQVPHTITVTLAVTCASSGDPPVFTFHSLAIVWLQGSKHRPTYVYTIRALTY